MSNILMFSDKQFTYDEVVYCVVDRNTNEHFHLEDTIQIFLDKNAAEKQLIDKEVVFLQEKDEAHFRKNAVIRKARLTTERKCLSDPIVFIALNDDLTIEADEDTLLYVYEDFSDLHMHSANQFVVATIKFLD